MYRLVPTILLLCSCAGPTGPIVGDWRGYQPAISYFYQRHTELILDGLPDADSGTYRLVTRTNDPLFTDRDNDFDWTDRWEKRLLKTAEGRSYLTVHLLHAPGTQDPDYIWTTDNLLVPLINPLKPDLGREALRIALYPVPRGSFGYGRP